MPPKKLFLDISSPRRTSPVVHVPHESIQQDSHNVRDQQLMSGPRCIFALPGEGLTCTVDILQDGGAQLQASVKVTENGSFNVFNRSQEFKFTPEGLFRRKGRNKGPSKEEKEQLSYKVFFI